MNAWRIRARSCGPFFTAAFLAASLSLATAAQGQVAESKADGSVLTDEQAIDEMLERLMRTPTTVDFADTPLDEAIESLAAQSKLTFVFDEKALTDASVETDTPVTLAVRDLKLESVLALLLNDLDLVWVYRHEVVMITSSAESEGQIRTRVYPVGDLLVRIGSANSPDLLSAVRQVSPSVWDVVGGPAAAEMLGGALLVSADRQTHADIRRLLDDLRRAYELPAPPAEASGPGPALQAALDKRLDVNFDEMPLIDACAALAERSGVQILLDHKGLEDAGVGVDTEVVFHVRDVSLRSALNLLLPALDLTWVIRHEVLIVTVMSSNCPPESPPVRVHPLGDLAGDSQRAERVRKLIMETISPDSLEKVWAYGSITILPGLLVVGQADHVQDEIAAVLARLRARGRSIWQESEGMPGYDGYRRVVYRVSRMSPDDVASAIKATIAPESWQEGQGNIQVIRAEAAPRPADAGGNAPSPPTEPPAADAPQAPGVDTASGHAAPPATGHLIVVQRSDAHDEIAKLLRELEAASGGEPLDSRNLNLGGFFRAP